ARDAQIGEGRKVFVGGNLQIRAVGPRVDSAAEPAERGVGVDRHDAVLAAKLGEDRAHTGGHGGLADTTLAQHPDFVVAPQCRPDGGFVGGVLLFTSRRAEVQQTEGGLVDDAPPAVSGAGLALFRLTLGPEVEVAPRWPFGRAGRAWGSGALGREVAV